MSAHKAFAAALALLLAVAAVAAAVAPAPAAASVAADGSLVTAALRVLEERYVDPVQPVPLLNAALAALRQAVPGGAAALPDIAPGTPQDRAGAQFAREFAAAAGPEPAQALAEHATAAMLASLRDDHTYYLDPAAYSEGRAETAGRAGFAGIGAALTARKDASGVSWAFVDDAFPGSPAARAGLARFDRLLAVDGQSLEGATARDAARLIRGPAGSTVRLTVQRGAQTLDVAVTRAPIQVPPVEARVVAPGVAYIKVFEFSRGAGRQVRQAVQALRAQGPVRTTVLDLRGNPGGLVVEAASVAGVFLPQDTALARIYERGQAPSVLSTSGSALLPDAPLVVLVDDGSGSASEILAGAFKDYHRAAIVGQKTAGSLNGSVTVALPIGGMSVTVERILGPKAEAIDGIGVAPDDAVALTAEDMERGRDAQLAAALALLGGGR